MTKLAVFKNAINIFCAFLYFFQIRAWRWRRSKDRPLATENNIYQWDELISACGKKKTKSLDSAPACSIFRVIFLEWSRSSRSRYEETAVQVLQAW